MKLEAYRKINTCWNRPSKYALPGSMQNCGLSVTPAFCLHPSVKDHKAIRTCVAPVEDAIAELILPAMFHWGRTVSQPGNNT